MKTLHLILCIFAGVVSSTHAQLFSDNFTRTNDPGTLSPWAVQSGTWTITGGVLKGGTNATFSYGDLYITNAWTNYSVQARLQFPAGSYGGGIAGRLNPATGARYAAWVYPENSAGGSNVLKLIKFQNWTAFGYTNISFIPMAQASLASVGTGFHTVKMAFQGSQITVSFDTTQVLSMTDAEAQPYASGAIGVDFWTDATGYQMTVDDVVVSNVVVRPVANNDSYDAVAGRTLTVAAPGVLANDIDGNGPLRAVLTAGPGHGTLNLSTNGGFTYTPTSGYQGTDSFTYRAYDPITNSSSATVTLNVTTNHPPVASADSYAVILNVPLIISAPGVLANDTDADGDALTAVLSSGPTNGTLTLNANGSFTYTPAANFIGQDSFRYRASDGYATSAVAMVNLSVISGGSLLLDNFSRTNDPGALAPWVAQAGNWMVTGGVMQGGTNPVGSYGYAYVTNNWTNYAVQARFQLPAGAFGGGLGACVNPTNGAHYAAWVYPENSPGGSNLLKLIKFQTWSSFGYLGSPGAAMQQVSLANVGTNWHSLEMAFFNGRIAVSFDGARVMTVTDQEAQPYLRGGVSLDFWTDATGYQMAFDDVMADPLVAPDSYTAGDSTLLSVPAPGVLGNDTPVVGTNLSAVLISGPTNGTLNFSTNGSFTYLPNTNYTGSDAFTYQASDGVTNLGIARVSLTVIFVNQPPMLPTQADRTLDELTQLTVTNAVIYDRESPPETFSYQLVGAPAGAMIGTNGVITWTPSEAQGPGTYTITTIATDSGSPPASGSNSFTVTVNEINLPPVLPVQADRTVNEMALMTITNAATDPDLPANALSYSLVTGPTNASISAQGVITWTPLETQGPSTNLFTVVVTDTSSNAVNDIHLSDTNTFTVVVNEVNAAPILPALANRTISPLTPLTVIDTATDPDVPANTLVYALIAGPTNAAISGDGIITWTPTMSDNYTTNLFRAVVTDTNPWAVVNQSLRTTNSFTVTVSTMPVLGIASTALAAESCLPTNNVIDPGETVTLLISLENIGYGDSTNLVATLLATNGVVSPSAPQTYGVVTVGGAAVAQPFTFMATGSCAGTIMPTLRLQDGGANLGTVSVPLSLGPFVTALTQSFDSVTAPALPSGWTTSASNAQPVWVTQTTTNDTPPNSAFSGEANNVGINELVSPVFTLPTFPVQLSFHNYYDLEKDATRATNGYDGGVLEIKIGTNDFVDILAAGGSFISGGYNRKIDTRYSNPLAGRWAWSGNSGGFTNTVVDLPPPALGTVAQLRWRCGTDNGGTSGSGWRLDSIAVNGWGCCANSPPILAALPDATVSEQTPMTVTNTVTSPGAPASPMLYSLINPPAGAAIDANGVVSWTPDETQGPSTNLITSVAVNSSVPSLAVTNSFRVVVQEINRAPILPDQTNYTLLGLQLLTVTNAATDADVPANALSYILLEGPTNAVIDMNGVITWTPLVNQVPSTNVVTTRVTDFNPWAANSQQLSATNSFTVIVSPVHDGPSLPPQADRTINELTSLAVTNTASSHDVPLLGMIYELVSPPAGANIDASGIITWTPSQAQSHSTNVITTIVSDTGTPPLRATNSFLVVVREVNVAPVLPAITDHTVNELTLLTVTNTATESNIHSTLGYVLIDPPAGALIDSSGVITWTPSQAQSHSTNLITTVATATNLYDTINPELRATNSFTVVVREVNVAPVLPVIPDQTINEGTLLTVTNTATESNIHSTVGYLLVDPPAGAAIDANGIIAWTPSQAQSPGTNLITTVATATNLYDLINPELRATNEFRVIVLALSVEAPRILSLALANDVATVTWSAVNGSSYTLQYKDNLGQSNWVDAQTGVVATGATAIGTNALGSAPHRFYRVVLTR